MSQAFEARPESNPSKLNTSHIEKKEGWISNVIWPIKLFSLERRYGHSFPLEVARSIRGKQRFSKEEIETIERITRSDWSATALSISNQEHIELAARGVGLGAIICYGFGNFYAVAAHPCNESVIHVNRSKGRPDNQVGSVTTTRERISRIFDWPQIPSALDTKALMDLINELYSMGPFGFRGPAAAGVPDHLTSQDGDKRTTQIIAPGYNCLSNALLERVLELTGQDFIFITSANISHNITGTTEEPAHYRMKGIQNDFGKCRGFIMVSHDDEEAIMQRYSKYRPMSTTILAFHKVTYDRHGQPQLFLERHGSLHVDDVSEVLKKHGFGLTIGPKAQSRLPERHYKD